MRRIPGQAPPAGPQWMYGLQPLEPHALAYDKPLCASLDGFTLHAATRAGALDPAGREALLRYVLRPPLAQERVEQRPFGLVRITLKPEDYATIGSTRLGGAPDLPPDIDYPMTEGRLWHFYAQINLEEIAGLQSWLPRTGRLYSSAKARPVSRLAIDAARRNVLR